MRARSLLPLFSALSLAITPAFAKDEEPDGGLDASMVQSLNDAIAPTPVANGEWTYDGESSNQDRWGELSPDYAVCLLGLKQSPINISHTEVRPLPAIRPQYKPSKTQITFKSNSLYLPFEKGNTLKIGSETYTLDHITFHSPGEHMILNNFFVAEVQFYHTNKQGKTLVLSSFLEVAGVVNDTLDSILQVMPIKEPGSVAKELVIDPSKLLPDEKKYFAYTGSLTTPPCTEGIEWRILKTPVGISDLQLRGLARYLGRNARATQPTYTREVLESTQ